MVPYDLPGGDLVARPAPAVAAGPFKDALARLASGVAIVSCWDGPTPRGLLVSSITGLSVDPPRLLFCVRKQASSHDALLRVRTCGVAILGTEDHDEGLRFASPQRASERFADPRWSLDPAAPPLYAGGLASAHCVIDQAIDAQTHSLLIVTARSLTVRPGPPLVAFARDFSTLAAL